MISAQIDELRNAAEFYDGFKAADLMREAADTIWQLRDDLQRANDAVRDAEHDESMAWDRVRKAEAENAKLRESVKRLMTQRDERLARAETDNAKLRELMADMLRYYAMPNDIDYKREADLLERAHEMGVDV